MATDNLGFDPAEIAEVKQKMQANGVPFLINEEEPNSDQFVHFSFVGHHENTEVIFDCVMYTLRLIHNDKLITIAEQEAAKEFPGYIPFDIDEEGNEVGEYPEGKEEDIEDFKATILLELEEEESVKVSESIELFPDWDYGVGLEVALNVEEITEQIIGNFVTSYISGDFKLDPTLYTFQHDDESEDDGDDD
jgi:hypothetical protein